jgi:hypothetical protein
MRCINQVLGLNAALSPVYRIGGRPRSPGRGFSACAANWCQRSCRPPLLSASWGMRGAPNSSRRRPIAVSCGLAKTCHLGWSGIDFGRTAASRTSNTRLGIFRQPGCRAFRVNPAVAANLYGRKTLACEPVDRCLRNAERCGKHDVRTQPHGPSHRLDTVVGSHRSGDVSFLDTHAGSLSKSRSRLSQIFRHVGFSNQMLVGLPNGVIFPTTCA